MSLPETRHFCLGWIGATIFQRVKIPREFCSAPCNIAVMSGGNKLLPWPPCRPGFEAGAGGVNG